MSFLTVPRPATFTGRKRTAQSETNSTAQFFRFRAAASGPGIKDAPPQARRLVEPQKHALFNHSNSARFVLGAPPRAANASPSPRTAILRIALLALAPKLGPARRENRFRFSRPKNRHSPKLAPVLRPVSASLRLRYRSAGAARHPKDGRATEFSHTVEFFRAPGEILSKAQVALNDFPL